MVLAACNVFPMTVFVLPLARRNIEHVLKKSLFIPHFTNVRPQLSTPSNLLYVAAYDTPFEMSDEANRNHLSRFGVVRSSCRCKLQIIRGIFNGMRVFGMDMSKPLPSFYPVRLKHKDQTPTCRKYNKI